MDKFLEGKRVLFIGQVFYDYHTKIICELERVGAKVVFFENKLFTEDPKINNSLLSKIKRAVNPSYKEKYLSNILNEVKKQNIDIVFFVGGFSVTASFMQGLKKLNPLIKSFFYTWDSVCIYDYTELYSFFDKVFSFDITDVNEKVSYLPLFYTDEYHAENSKEEDIDLFYLGSVGLISENRISLLKDVESQISRKNLKSFIWLYYPKPSTKISVISNFVKKVISKKHAAFFRMVLGQHAPNFIKHDVLNRNEVVGYLKQSKIVLDIPVPGQNGLTIRTIEALALGKKLITTNKNIIAESFYNPNAILVINEEKPIITDSFLSGNGQEHRVNVDYLKIQNWIRNIFYG